MPGDRTNARLACSSTPRRGITVTRVVRVSHLAVASAIWAVTIAMAFAGRYHGTTEAAAAPSTARDGTQGARV